MRDKNSYSNKISSKIRNYCFPLKSTGYVMHHQFNIQQLYALPTLYLCVLYSSENMGEERGAYRVLVGKPEGKRLLGRPRRRWVDNIRMDLKEVGCGYVDWIGLAQDRDRWRTLVSA